MDIPRLVILTAQSQITGSVAHGGSRNMLCNNMNPHYKENKLI